MRNLVVFGERVDQVGCGHALGHAVAPAARLHQVIEEQRDDVVRLDKGAVAVDDAEAVRVAVGGDDQSRADLLHLFLRVAEQVVVRLRRVAAEEHIAVVVDGFNGDAGLAQQVGMDSRGPRPRRDRRPP